MEKGDEESVRGIYIPNMEMPETCYECPCGDNEFYECLATKERFSYHRDEYGYPDGERQDWCPLIKVPPHGDLIDRDAFRASIRESLEECNKWANEADHDTMMYARISQSVGTFVECSLRAKSMPTIIPAEEGE